MTGPRLWLVIISAVLAAVSGACSRNLTVWHWQNGAATRLDGVPFFVKKQRYKSTHSLEHRWYRLTLKAIPVFPTEPRPPSKDKPSQGSKPEDPGKPAEPRTGPSTTYTFDVPREKREVLVEVLDLIRSANAESVTGGATTSLKTILDTLKDYGGGAPYDSAGVWGAAIDLGRTIEPLVVVDYATTYLLNSGKSLGANKLTLKLSGDGTLTEAQSETAGSLREVSGAIGDIAAPVGGILEGIGTIREAAQPEAIRPKGPPPATYRLEATTVEAGVRDDYILISDSIPAPGTRIDTVTGVSHSRHWFVGSESAAKAGDGKDEDKEANTIDIRGSVRLPKADAKPEKPKDGEKDE
jgi:hypothetical protein